MMHLSIPEYLCKNCRILVVRKAPYIALLFKKELPQKIQTRVASLRLPHKSPLGKNGDFTGIHNY